LLKVDQYEFIRTAHRVYGKSISELARLTGHSRNTVKKAIRCEPWGYKERAEQSYPTLGPFLAIIDQWLSNDREQPRKQRHTARRVFNRLRAEHGFQGSESTVRRYVRAAKLQLGLDPSCKVFIPCEPDAGREAEVDWGSATAMIAGEALRLKFFCMRSKYSGKHFVRFYACERQQAFFDGHIKAFEFFDGLFPVLIYDNLTSAVRKVLKGRNRLEQEAFRKFRAFYHFEARFCTPGNGNEKGGVEGLVGFARRNYMVPVPQAASLEELNEQILRQCLAHGAHRMEGHTRSVQERYDAEKRYLIGQPQIAYSNIQIHEARADKYATVVVDKNRYSVPWKSVGQKLRVLVDVERVEIFAGGKKLAVHERLYGNNKWSLLPDHYLDLIQQRPMSFNSARPIRQWRAQWPESLNRLLATFCRFQGETKGIKEFISVLMLYRQYAPSEVEAAVALALEKHIHTSEGVAHILIYTNESGPAIESLANWAKLPAPDVSLYGVLGGVQ